MSVSDTGVGYEGDLDELFQKGIGVSNIERRLGLLFGERLEVERCEGGLKFWFRVPVRVGVEI